MGNQVLIFEGHDRCGKTTIANKLAERFNTQVFMTNSRECFTSSEAPGNLSVFNYYLAKYVQDIYQRKELNKPIIIYRSFLSEMVYAKLFNRETSDFHNKAADVLFNRVNATIILCKNNRTVYGDETLPDSMVQKSADLFDHYKMMVRCKVLELDTSSHNVDEYINSLVKQLSLE